MKTLAGSMGLVVFAAAFLSSPAPAQDQDEKDRRIAALEREVAELKREVQAHALKRKEAELDAETLRARIDEVEETKARLLREQQDRIDDLLKQQQRAMQRLEQNLQQYERQVTDLRQRIMALSVRNEELQAELRAGTQKFKDLEARLAEVAGRDAAAFVEVEHLGASLSIPSNFTRTGGGDAFRYLFKDGAVSVSIETGAMPNGGLEALFRREYEKRCKDRIERLGDENAYRILGKKNLTIDGRAAFEVEQEYASGTGDPRTHDLVVNVDLGNGRLLSVRWAVEDVSDCPWEKTYARHFEASRRSLKLK